MHDLDLVAFNLPLIGPPILSLCRMLRRSHSGYRGISRPEVAERQGAFVWRLSERPLPMQRAHVDRALAHAGAS